MMDRPFPIVDGDGHVTETDEQVRRYMPEPFRSSRERMDEKWELRGAAEAPELKRPPTDMGWTNSTGRT